MTQGNIQDQPNPRRTITVQDFVDSINKNIIAINESFESPDSTAAQAAATVKLYHLTAVYKVPKHLDIEKKIPLVKKYHEGLYFHILKSILPYYAKRRNKPLQPIFYNFVDMPGTRKGQPNELGDPHVHSLVIMHPRLVAEFEELIQQDFLKAGGMLKSKVPTLPDSLVERSKVKWSMVHTVAPRAMRNVLSIHCGPLGDTEGDKSRWIGYSAKLLETPLAKFRFDEELRSELFDMLPKHRGLT
jgi:hypothetical protein